MKYKVGDFAIYKNRKVHIAAVRKGEVTIEFLEVPPDLPTWQDTEETSHNFSQSLDRQIFTGCYWNVIAEIVIPYVPETEDNYSIF